MPHDVLPLVEVIDDDMAKVLRQKSPAERLAIAHGMWDFARTMIISVLRGQHADWSEAQIQHETTRRLSHGAA